MNTLISMTARSDIIARATDVLGSHQDAEAWLHRPAIGLDNRCPVDLLTSAEGTKEVQDYLTKMDHGVYI